MSNAKSNKRLNAVIAATTEQLYREALYDTGGAPAPHAPCWVVYSSGS